MCFLRHSGRLAICVVSGWLLAAIAGELRANIIDDDFGSGMRSGWFNSSTSPGLSVSGGALVSSSGSPTLVRYFAGQSLAVGDQLTLTFTFSASDIADKPWGWRIGLLKSGAQMVSADNFGASASFSDYQGYRLVTNLGAKAPGSTVFQKRDDASVASLLGGSWRKVGDSTVGVNLVSGVTYPVTVKMVRTGASSLELGVSMNGVVITSAIDKEATNFTFDTLGIFKDSAAAYSMRIDDVVLTSQVASSSVR